MSTRSVLGGSSGSPSTRRAWIEIRMHGKIRKRCTSPSTRRAWIEIPRRRSGARKVHVALHPEGVDRNVMFVEPPLFVYSVALHPEGVDRNSIYEVLPAILELSPSTRRAWIEILTFTIFLLTRNDVALHPEGVDRNIIAGAVCVDSTSVALHPEGVDRNVPGGKHL